MYQAEMIEKLKLDLHDADETSRLWTDDQLKRAIKRSVAEMSRHYPLEAIYEHTIVQTVTDEASTAPAAGTYLALTYKPIDPESEVVKSATGTTYTRDTDYTMDYANGEYTIISTGSITAADTLAISYDKDTLGIDISTLISDLIRIVHVEYPVGNVPQQKVAFSIWNDFMYIGSQQTGQSQKSLTDKEHIAIHYEKVHTPPTTTADGSYAEFMDDIVLVGAAAYSLLAKALQQEHQGVTDLAAMRTELGLTTAKHALVVLALAKVTTNTTLATTALTKVPLYLETNDTTDNAKDVLANITDNIADLRTKVLVAQAAMATGLGLVRTNSLDKATTGAEAYLDTYDENINAVNLGADVPGGGTSFSRARVEIALARVQEAQALGVEATSRLENLKSYIEEAGGWMHMGEIFINEATQRIAIASSFIYEAQAEISQIDRYLAEAAQYKAAVDTDMLLSDRFRAEGQSRLDEFHGLLKSRAEYRKRVASVPVRQPA